MEDGSDRTPKDRKIETEGMKEKGVKIDEAQDHKKVEIVKLTRLPQI